MEILKFIKWWWNNRDTPEKFLAVFLTMVVLLPLNIWLFGPVSLLVFFGILLTILFVSALYSLIKGIKNQWLTYKKVQEEEAQEIVDRLAGRSSSHFKFIKKSR